MKKNIIAVLIFSLHQMVFPNQLDFVGINEQNKVYNLMFSLEKTALILSQSSNSPFSISLEFKETSLKENFNLEGTHLSKSPSSQLTIIGDLVTIREALIYYHI